jgi:hypothetical protein
MKRNTRFLILSLFIILSSVSSIFAQKFTCSVNRNSVEVGEQIQISFKLENADGGNFKAPLFKGFTILMGPSQSSQTSWINGKVSRSLAYIYVLRAEMPGQHTISSADIKTASGALHSNPVTITVTKPNGKSNQAQSPNNLAGQGSKQSKNAAQAAGQDDLDKQAKDIISKNCFIRVSATKSSVYKGEPLYAVYKLYVHPELELMNISAQRMPMYNGFWAQEIEIPKIVYSTTETINGVKYKVAELKKVILSPQQTGELTIDPFEMDFIVRLRVQEKRRNRDPFFDDFFDDPFFASYREFKYSGKSTSAKVKVLPLPEPTPQGFNGAVGSYKFEANVDKQKGKTNEPITLKLKLHGNGNIKLAQAPDFTLPSEIEKFDPKINDNISLGGGSMSGDKTYEYILIPRSSGKYKIPSISFVYFDLDKKKYQTISSEAIDLEIEKGAFQDYNPTNKQDVAALNSDVKFIKEQSSFNKKGFYFAKDWSFYLWALAPIVAFIIAFWYKKKKEEDDENIDLINSKNAMKFAKKRFANARKQLEAGDVKAFYQETHTAILDYLSNRYFIAQAELTKEQIKMKVSDDKNSELCDELITILEKCEFARYAPVGSNEDAGAVLNDSEIIIAKLEGK